MTKERISKMLLDPVRLLSDPLWLQNLAQEPASHIQAEARRWLEAGKGLSRALRKGLMTPLIPSFCWLRRRWRRNPRRGMWRL